MSSRFERIVWSVPLLGSLMSCGGAEDRAPFLADGDALGDGDCDAGDCESSQRDSSGSMVAEGLVSGERTCMSGEQAAEFDDPLIGTLRRFETDYFNPEQTEPAGGVGELEAESELDPLLACAESTQAGYFELFGGADGSGPLVIRPAGEANWVSTVINSVRRAGRTFEAVPVFGRADIASIFEQLGVAPERGKAQVLIEFAAVVGGTRERVSNVAVLGTSGRVAYRIGDEWTFDEDVTGSDGLALVVNVDANDGLGVAVDMSYIYHAVDPDKRVPMSNLTAVSDAVTYVAVTPEGHSAGAF